MPSRSVAFTVSMIRSSQSTRSWATQDPPCRGAWCILNLSNSEWCGIVRRGSVVVFAEGLKDDYSYVNITLAHLLTQWHRDSRPRLDRSNIGHEFVTMATRLLQMRYYWGRKKGKQI
ncbi:hypothetical protein TNCV_730921 [Trichonephila clavipes]|nr:hypothetical protein TNCV_730921 [Trichonephila clavipes]